MGTGCCCFTGHRKNGFPWKYARKRSKPHRAYLRALKDAVGTLYEGGCTRFMSGGAIGADTDFALTVLKLRKRHPDIRLEVAVPCPEQDRKWQKRDKALYRKILKKADKQTLLSPAYSDTCMKERNRYMVGQADFVLAAWNGIPKGGTYATICIARQSGKKLKILYLNDFL